MEPYKKIYLALNRVLLLLQAGEPWYCLEPFFHKSDMVEDIVHRVENIVHRVNPLVLFGHFMFQ